MSAWEEALKEQKEKQASSEESPEEGDESCGEEKFELLKDIPLEVTIEVGSTSLPLEEVLKLHPNSIVELDRYIHEPVDIKVNGRLIAKGELYTVKDSYGIKITQIITPEERLKLLEE
ncbi:flagellar motor switch protein FliN/FliY [Phorcysia thermohydrogeniphila]|uniref:Flagellar motor switch protein FliN n=2 Tax=Phorcysia thermohydrogeniphila TaxID=936138 RepID=A0A4R1G8H3_9BACT|nr:flagellar motor switch protein FliN/FliY [Phorcysia thermohydrogeniphila]